MFAGNQPGQDTPTGSTFGSGKALGVKRAFQLPICVGLHTGECETFGDDVTGAAVRLAARIEQSAEPGEVMISGTVRDLIAGAGLQLEERGLRVLKGFPEPIRLFVVV